MLCSIAIQSLIRSLEGTHALEADFLLNLRMAVLRVGGEGGASQTLGNQLRVNR